MFELISVKVILTINRRGDQHEASEIVYREWMIAFPQHVAGQVFEINRRVEKLTAEMLILEDGGDEGRNASEY